LAESRWGAFSSGIRSRWGALSTGLKMFLILSLGLLPLGLIAISASIDNARANRDKGAVEARSQLTVHVQRFALALSRNAASMRAARDAILEASDPTGVCDRTLARLARFPNTPGRFALYGEGSAPRCQSQGFTPPAAPPGEGQAGRGVITPHGERLIIYIYQPDGALEGIAVYDRATLAELVNKPVVLGDFTVDLVQGDRVMPLRPGPEAGAFDRAVTVDFPFANAGYAMRLTASIPPVTATDVLVILTPVLMWLWASLVGWIIVQRLLLRPLGRLQKEISAYHPETGGFDLPSVRSPAHEIDALGQAFDQVTRTVARHEADLEAAVVRQTRLVREVHHRVKNNLQVVASLLNLHSRGAASEDAAAAYASIQRRVDALSVVHRNHFAELEANRGVALKSLISELAANLRATAPPSAAGMQIRLDIAPVYVTQDVAVSVAFLITEVVEFGMLCGASQVSVAIDPDSEAMARLSIEVDSLAQAVECDEALADRFDRIVTGLARQLRSVLERDPTRGRYSVLLGVLRDDS
jgi:two-component sensor histidine kinase